MAPSARAAGSEKIPREQSLAWSHLDHREWIGMAKKRIELLCLFCQSLSKNRMHVGAGVKIPRPADPLLAGILGGAHVIAELRMIQG